MARFENRLQNMPAGERFLDSVAAKALNYLCLSNTYGNDFVALLNKLHLLRRTHHKFIFITPCVCVLHVRPLSQAVIRHVNTNVI